jgi:indole-3-glycerol phosphate synthase
MSERGAPEGIISAGGVLDRIVEAKARRLAEIKQSRTVEPRPVARSFAEALVRSDRVNVIAEIKRRSPSKGIIRERFDPAVIAAAYEEAGAAAISVLTEEDFFGGSLDHLRVARERVNRPLLRKDFIFDEYQVYEAAAAGADAILLIAAILDDRLLSRLLNVAAELGVDALVEVHTERELERAARAGSRIIGVNNRDLTSFEVDIETSLRLVRLAPPDAILVSESGITSAVDIRRLRDAGFTAFLIGEYFMRAVDPGAELARLIADSDDGVASGL